MDKTFQPIRIINNDEVRAIYDEETMSWWYAASDVIHALTKSTNGRRYWNVVKTRHFHNFYLYRQFKLLAKDKKYYKTDVLNELGIKELIKILRNNHIVNYEEIINTFNGSLIDQSKNKCYQLYNYNLLNIEEIYTSHAPIQIHGFIYEGICSFYDEIRQTNNIDSSYFISELLLSVDYMPNTSLYKIIDKAIEYILVKPFVAGNEIVATIWLDMMVRKKFKKCIDWSLVDKDEYLLYLGNAHIKPKPLRKLLKKAQVAKSDDTTLINITIDWIYELDRSLF